MRVHLLFGSRGRSLAVSNPRGEKKRERKTEVEHSITTRIIAAQTRVPQFIPRETRDGICRPLAYNLLRVSPE